MKITPGADLLVRAAISTPGTNVIERRQATEAKKLLTAASLIAITTPTLCEFAWILRRGYKIPVSDIALAIRALCAGSTVVCDRPAVEAGLAMLLAGGEFADGVIAHEGATYGAELFTSFDREAVRRLVTAGVRAKEAGVWEEPAKPGALPLDPAKGRGPWNQYIRGPEDSA